MGNSRIIQPTLEYMRAPLHKYTFSIAPIRKWVESNCAGNVLNLFAGQTHLCVNEVRNDIRESADATYHMDALEFVRSWNSDKFDTIVLDPPYSYRKSMEMYEGKIMSPFQALKNTIPNILHDNGVVITFGYHSVSMGASRKFVQQKILLIYHGGAIHDTIAVKERRVG